MNSMALASSSRGGSGRFVRVVWTSALLDFSRTAGLREWANRNMSAAHVCGNVIQPQSAAIREFQTYFVARCVRQQPH
jgi:hypothetical protein